MAERKVWTEQEDEILKTLVQKRKVNKWSQISKIFSCEYGINHRNGKQCRERYLNHLASGLRKGDWTEDEEERLIKLHNSYGNRWAEIARNFDGRTDNCVKNQLYSRLRKSLRFINDFIERNLRKKFKLLKINFIYKLIEMADQKYKSRPAIKTDAFQESFQLKNKILKFQCDEQKSEEQKVISLIGQINRFNKKYKKRLPKKRSRKDAPNSQNEAQGYSSSVSDEIHQKIQDPDKKCLPQTQIQIKISAPLNQQKAIYQANRDISIEEVFDLKRKEGEAENFKTIDRLHSLSIQKESSFLKMFTTIQPQKKLEESINYSLFSRVDPLVHGEQNQHRVKAKRSSSNEQVPNIMVDIGNREEFKEGEPKIARLRSFGSIEQSYEFEQDRDPKPSSFEKQFMNKEQVEYWLSNVK